MVIGFNHSVLQCDGHSGLMKLQDQVGKDLSLPTQTSPPYSHQSQGTVERFRKTLCGQNRRARLQQGELNSFGSFRKASSGSCSIRTSLLKASCEGLSLRSTTHCGWASVSSLAPRIVAHSGQILKARTVTHLIKEQQFNSVEFTKSFFLLTNANPTIKNLKKIALPFKSCSGLSSCNRSPRCCQKTSSPWIRGSRSPLNMLVLISRLHQPRERINHHHQPHCIVNVNLSTLANTSSSWISNAPWKPQQQPQQSGQQPGQIRRRSLKNSKPRESTEVAAIIQDIKDNHLPSVRIRSTQITKKPNQRQSHSFFRSGIKKSSGMFSRSDQNSNHQRNQTNRSSRS